ncbi:MAG: AMP-binding protein [Candidatus Anammoximicrobium sp.]|nr:AMP-binding protein [Candidatus Anammoximicrobium sp.]
MSTLVDLLHNQAATLGEKVAFRFLPGAGRDELILTYCDLHRRAMGIAAELQTRTVPGDRVLLSFASGLEFVEAFFGCLYAGVVAVPVAQPGRRRPVAAVQAICRASKPLLILGTAEQDEAGATSTADLSLQLQLPWIASDRVPTQRLGDWRDPQIGPQQTAFLQYTSGSTSTPKGVILSHENVLSNAALIQEAFGTSVQSSAAFWLPLYHDMGLIGGVIQPVYCGGTSTLLAPASFLQRPALWLETISRTRATISGGPDFAFNLCSRKVTQAERVRLDLSSWEVAFTGAERIRPHTLEQFAEAFAPCGFRTEAFFPCYGLAEATLMVSGGPRGVAPTVIHAAAAALAQDVVQETSRDDTNARSLVGCGRSLTGQHVVIVEPEGCRACPDGRIGEIWVQGDSVAAGYFDNPGATADVFGARLADTREGPFLRTGDLGVLRDGQLFVTGRLKDLIIIRGRNYYPEDIELTVEGAHPSFRAGHCAAFSAEIADEERLIVVQEIEPRTRTLDSEAAFQAVRQAIAAAFEVELYSIVLAKAGIVPKTTSGKRRRAACRDLFLRDALEVHARWTAQITNGHPHPLISKCRGTVYAPTAKEIEDWLVQRIAARMSLSTSQVQVTRPFLEMGMGSLDAMEVAADLQTWLDRRLSPTAIYNYPNIASLANWLASPAAQTMKSPSPTPAVTSLEDDFDPDRLLRDVQQLSEEDMVAFISQELARQSQPMEKRDREPVG